MALFAPSPFVASQILLHNDRPSSSVSLPKGLFSTLFMLNSLRAATNRQFVTLNAGPEITAKLGVQTMPANEYALLPYAPVLPYLPFIATPTCTLRKFLLLPKLTPIPSIQRSFPFSRIVLSSLPSATLISTAAH